LKKSIRTIPRVIERVGFCPWGIALLAPFTFASCGIASFPSVSNRTEAATGGARGLDDWGDRPGPRGFKTVVIDPGHGGKDSGAISQITGQKEKDLTLDVAKRVRSQLPDFKVILMRDDDTFVELDERARRADLHPDAMLVSIHFNSGPSPIRGPETYFWRVDSHGMAVRLQKAMAAVCPSQTGNRGLVRRRIRLTRNPRIPCVLVEGGYISNPQESVLIQTPAYRQKLASAIAGAIRSQSVNGDTGTGPPPPFIKAPASRPTDVRE
jgi:N-acetylmuramoyl-L-alanine amidase